MIADIKLDDLVVQHVTQAVDQYVSAILDQQDWQLEIENKLQQHLRDRITAKFSNLAAIPEIQHSIESGLVSLFQNGQIPGVEKYIDQTNITQLLRDQAQSAVTDLADRVTVDPDWLQQVEKNLQQAMTQRLLNQISNLDLDAYIVKSIDAGIDRWQHRFLENFRTAGIVDSATACELTVVDGAVVVSNAMATPTLLVERDAEIQGILKAKDLVLTGSINVDCESWQELANYSADIVEQRLGSQWRQQLVESVLESSKQSGIDFASVTVKGKPLVDGEHLSSAITESSLRSLGTLRDLKVHGPVQLSDTVFVKNKRLGINTQDPESALSLWDEEVSITLGKHSRDTAFIGTTRKQSLVIGANHQPDIVIDDQGIISLRTLRIDRWRISHSDKVPGWSGTKGDFVINTNPSDKAPFAWSCLGGYRWIELRSR
jgi:hypothetical protein